MLRLLLDHGADPAQRRSDGTPPGEMEVGRADVPITRTLVRVVPSGFVLQGDPDQFGLLATIMELVVADLGAQWQERTGHTDAAALAFAGRLRTDPAPAARASWHSVTATRRKLTALRSALVEVAQLRDHRLPGGTSRSAIADLTEDFLRQVDR